MIDPDRGIFILADGMGGRQGGNVASTMVVQTMPELIQSALHGAQADAIGVTLGHAVSLLNQRVVERSLASPELTGMGATLVALVVQDALAHVVSLGDSRAYLWRAQTLQQLTSDHTLAELLVELHHITQDQATDHPGRHRLTRYIGMEGEPEPDVRSMPLASGDRVLLCSDGLTRMVPDDQLAAILNATAAPDAACQALIAAANTAGGRDNVSAIVVDVPW